MEFFAEIEHKPGLLRGGLTIRREAVRAVIVDGQKLLMIYSRQNGDYKFPGGGVIQGETPAQAVIREVREEAGADVLRVGERLGQMNEYDQPVEPELDLFMMTSTYYRCEIAPGLNPQRLDDYEQELGFEPVWIEIEEAVRNNRALLAAPPPDLPRWVQRDTQVLEFLINLPAPPTRAIR
jgi:8-oxo-dGTP pyrophosphatase MutT (NUDIX family)